MTTKGISLRQSIIKADIHDEAAVKAHIQTAYRLIKTVPELRISRYNFRRPMQNIHEA